MNSVFRLINTFFPFWLLASARIICSFCPKNSGFARVCGAAPPAPWLVRLCRLDVASHCPAINLVIKMLRRSSSRWRTEVNCSMLVVQQPRRLGLQALNDVLLASQERMTTQTAVDGATSLQQQAEWHLVDTAASCHEDITVVHQDAQLVC